MLKKRLAAPKYIYPAVLLLAVTLVYAIPLLNLPTTRGHDIFFHLQRIDALADEFRLGNYMPRIRPNYTFGIRTPWTLASETVWKKTHRVGGYVFVVSGIIIAVCSFFRGWAALIGIGVLLAGTIVSSVYSWLVFREEQNHNH